MKEDIILDSHNNLPLSRPGQQNDVLCCKKIGSPAHVLFQFVFDVKTNVFTIISVTRWKNFFNRA